MPPGNLRANFEGDGVETKRERAIDIVARTRESGNARHSRLIGERSRKRGKGRQRDSRMSETEGRRKREGKRLKDGGSVAVGGGLANFRGRDITK